MKKGMIPVIACLLLLNFLLAGCYYDKAELLYPDKVCDSVNVRYTTSVAPILSSSCTSCHGGNTPSGNVKLDTYAGISIVAANGKLWGAVSHSTGVSPMPKNSPKLSTCNLAVIKKWLDTGFPNN